MDVSKVHNHNSSTRHTETVQVKEEKMALQGMKSKVCFCNYKHLLLH